MKPYWLQDETRETLSNDKDTCLLETVNNTKYIVKKEFKSQSYYPMVDTHFW